MFKNYLEDITSFAEWNTYVNRIPMLKIGVEILKKLEKYGDAYIVGGAVRDIVIGNKEPDDIDIATNVPIKKIEELFESHDIGKNKDFGIVVITYKGFTYEIANFRRDGTYSDGRHPESVEIVMSFEDDAARRDFTINAMAIDSNGNVIDYFDGMNAIQNKVLKTVGDPEQRFKEDYLRMMRMARFASRLNYTIDKDSIEAVKKLANNITNVSSERILQEILKAAEQSGDRFAQYIEILYEANLLKYILPEIVNLKDMEHSLDVHPEGPNVYDHVISAIRANDIATPIVNLAILLHDIGKLTTKTYVDGRAKYLGHAQAGISLIEEIASRLKMDNETKDALIFACENHMKLHDFLNMSNAKIFSLIKNKHWNVLYNVALADQKARGDLFSKQEWDKIIKKIEEVTLKYANTDFSNNLKKIVNGELVMKLKNLKPGPEVGKTINKTIDWILNNNIDINDINKINDYIKKV